VVLRQLLTALEDEDEPRPALAWLAARELELDDDELRGAVRRALLLLAAGGDPRRALDPDGRAVRAVAADLMSDDRAVALRAALGRLRPDAGGLPRIDAALDALESDVNEAWRWLACALLAEELGD
jgi:hypothetical protein